jgi:hypothetical protein
MTLQAGGTSSAQDYYGVDVTWFSGAAFSRPIFDLERQVPTSEPGGYHHDVIFANGKSFVTLDSLEVRNQGLPGVAQFATTMALQFYGTQGCVIQGVDLHDWVTDAVISNATFTPDYAAGAILGPVILRRSPVSGLTNIIDDSGGTAKNSAGMTIPVGMGGACMNCLEASWTRFTKTEAACFTANSCHDNEMTGISQTVWDAPVPAGFGLDAAHRPHTQVIEDDCGCLPNELVYNNYVHDNPTVGVTLYVPYSARVFNNVISNGANRLILITSAAAGIPAGGTGQFVNNTVDCSNAAACFGTDSKQAISGTVILKNNQWITSGTPVSNGSPISNFIESNNVPMTVSEATSQGYVAGNKYAPTGSNGGTVHAGVNLSTSCVGAMAALCSDAAGAPWYGATPVSRGSTWDIGAYQFNGGAAGGGAAGGGAAGGGAAGGEAAGGGAAGGGAPGDGAAGGGAPGDGAAGGGAAGGRAAGDGGAAADAGDMSRSCGCATVEGPMALLLFATAPRRRRSSR